jgi:hypothetical protein
LACEAGEGAVLSLIAVEFENNALFALSEQWAWDTKSSLPATLIGGFSRHGSRIFEGIPDADKQSPRFAAGTLSVA